MSKGKKKEPIVSKFVRDAIFTAIAGMIIEPTLKGLKIEITPYLQWIWWAMFAFLMLTGS